MDDRKEDSVCAAGLPQSILLLGVTAAGARETKAPEACKLLTLQDVTNVVGSGFKRTPPELYNAGPFLCAYNKGSADTVGFFIGEPDPGPLLKDQQARFKKGGLAVTPVAGLGEGAFYVIVNDKLTLYFVVGQRYAQLGVQTRGKPNVDATLKLARIVRSRMP